LQEGQDIFGVDFDYDEFEKHEIDEYEEEDEDLDEYTDEEDGIVK
jgi:transcription elongation factor SPT6